VSRTSKGVVVCVTAVALLMGGIGTFLLWTEHASATAGSGATGTLRMQQVRR